MIDIQGSHDTRGVRIRKVGINNIRIPLTWVEHQTQNTAEADLETPTVGEFAMLVMLPAEQKGTHMSRFLETLYEHGKVLSRERLAHLTTVVRDKLNAPEAHTEVGFTWFFDKLAPVTKMRGVSEAQVKITCSVKDDGEVLFEQKVAVLVQSLCPCSKAISQYGAHNQRSLVTITTTGKNVPSLAEVVACAEEAGSSQLYPVLKREDERYVTERAYENPRFVEDLVREAALNVKKIYPEGEFQVSAENFESIHIHNVWALVTHEDL